MSGLSKVAGIGPRVTLNGREYQVRGKPNRFFAEVQEEIIRRRGNPMSLIVEAGRRGKVEGDPDLVTKVAEVVSEKFLNWQFVTYGDYLDFLTTPDGDAFTAYHCLRPDAPEITLEEVREYVVGTNFKGLGSSDEAVAAKKEIEQLYSAIASASGETSGNSNGQTPKPDTTGT